MLLQSAGTATQSISATFEDFQWAYAVFWYANQQDPATTTLPQYLSATYASQRACLSVSIQLTRVPANQIPLSSVILCPPRHCDCGAGHVAILALFPRSRSITFPEPNNCPAESSVVGQPREGIVPGLDFCNHHPEAHCRWSVWNPASSQVASREPASRLVRTESQYRDLQCIGNMPWRNPHLLGAILNF